MTTATTALTYSVSNHGTLFLVRPADEASRQTLLDITPDDAPWFGGALAVEHRFIGDIVAALIDLGAEVGGES